MLSSRARGSAPEPEPEPEMTTWNIHKTENSPRLCSLLADNIQFSCHSVVNYISGHDLVTKLTQIINVSHITTKSRFLLRRRPFISSHSHGSSGFPSCPILPVWQMMDNNSKLLPDGWFLFKGWEHCQGGKIHLNLCRFLQLTLTSVPTNKNRHDHRNQRQNVMFVLQKLQ